MQSKQQGEANKVSMPSYVEFYKPQYTIVTAEQQETTGDFRGWWGG